MAEKFHLQNPKTHIFIQALIFVVLFGFMLVHMTKGAPQQGVAPCKGLI